MTTDPVPGGDMKRAEPTLWLGVKLDDAAAKALAMDGGEPPESLHVTLAYAGKQSELPPDVVDRTRLALAAVLPKIQPIDGVVHGIGRFGASDSSDGKDVICATPDIPGLAGLRHDLVEALLDAGVPVKATHDFVPHITLKYVDSSELLELAVPKATHVSISSITMDAFGEEVSFELGKMPPEPDEGAVEVAASAWAEKWQELAASLDGPQPFAAHCHWKGLPPEAESATPDELMKASDASGGEGMSLELRFATPSHGAWGIDVQPRSVFKRLDRAFGRVRAESPLFWIDLPHKILKTADGIGRYERVDGGSWTLVEASADRVLMRLSGAQGFAGLFSWSRVHKDQWVLQRESFLKASSKREAGEEFPPEAFAYVPDPETPSSWKIRLWESLDRKETPKQVGAAIAAIGAGFRGNKAEIPPGELARVKARIRAAWRKVHPESGADELPNVLKTAPILAWAADPSLSSGPVRLQRTEATDRVDVPARILKRDAARRYTLGVAYPAAEVDVHGDFMSPAELEDAAWRYMLGSQRIGLMHRPLTEGAGRPVESYIYRGPDWEVNDQTVKSGDWLLGVIWDQEVWDRDVSTGKMRGYSMQGFARRVPKAAPNTR